MPKIILPPSIEAARCSKPVQPRLVSWYEWPVRAAGFALPVVLLGTYLAGWLARGPAVSLGVLVLHLFALKLVLIAHPTKLMHGLVHHRHEARHGVEWLGEAWYRPAAIGALATVPAWIYGSFVENVITHVLKLFRAAPLVYPVDTGVAVYLAVVAAAAFWGLGRAGTYNRTFRERFQAFKRAVDDLDGFRRKAVWEAVCALPRADFDGRRSNRGEPTPTALALVRALQARGHRLADAPGGEADGPRLILEYELVGLRRGKYNYRADLALVIPGKNVKLDIELDGGYHHTPIQQAKDYVRNQVFVGRGWAVLRFGNEEVNRNVQACASEVERVLAVMAQAPRMGFDEARV